MSNILTVDNLNYNEIFENLSLTVEKNKFITISGCNNCGKTTLMRILSDNINNSNKIKLYDKNINDYKLYVYIQMVQLVIPLEIIYRETTLEEELLSIKNEHYNEKKELYNFIVKGLGLKKFLTLNVEELKTKEIILSQIAIALISKPEILLLDDISKYFDKKELNKIFTFLKEYNDKYELTLIHTTINLNLALYTDYLYIIGDKKILLEGLPIQVLEKDNIINKIGLSLPFMIDLSVKLRDYDLIDSIELEKDRMIDKLWK